MGMWMDGILGVVVGDALGCPVQFESREEVSYHPVEDMRGYGTFNLPEGSWTDDSSLTLALLDSINKTNEIDIIDIMDRFVEWLENGDYTPYGYSYDIGRSTMNAIKRFEISGDAFSCGGHRDSENGNGSLMRIMPCCLYCVANNMDDVKAIETVHAVGSLTHAHIRSNIACGLYYFMVKAILKSNGTLIERLQTGLNKGFDFYSKNIRTDELKYYDYIKDLHKLSKTPINQIRSSGYVVDTIGASLWSLVTTNSFKNALLTAVNLGLDTDTVGAIAGGLGGLFYGINDKDGIPSSWIDKIKRIAWIKDMCNQADNK